MEDLVLLHDELLLTMLFVENVEIYVRIGHYVGYSFLTTNEISQVECLSVILSIEYLTFDLWHHPYLQDRNYNRPTHLEEPTSHFYAGHNLLTKPEATQELYQYTLTIFLPYADDCGFVFLSQNKHLMNNQMVITTPLLM